MGAIYIGALDGSELTGQLDPCAPALVPSGRLPTARVGDELGAGTEDEPLAAIKPSPYDWLMAASDLPSIVGVAVLGDHMLRLLFDDGTVGDVDFSHEGWKGVLQPLRDPAYFAKVRVDPDAGTITWPNGVDLAPEALYERARARPLTPS